MSAEPSIPLVQNVYSAAQTRSDNANVEAEERWPTRESCEIASV
jgi:hypothetical protein